MGHYFYRCCPDCPPDMAYGRLHTNRPVDGFLYPLLLPVLPLSRLQSCDLTPIYNCALLPTPQLAAGIPRWPVPPDRGYHVCHSPRWRPPPIPLDLRAGLQLPAMGQPAGDPVECIPTSLGPPPPSNYIPWGPDLLHPCMHPSTFVLRMACPCAMLHASPVRPWPGAWVLLLSLPTQM